MGKYMKKSHITADVSLTEFSQSAASGVRTRAKTLALQRLTSPPPPPPPSNSDPSSSYLQLRSRRLEKPPPGVKDSRRIQPKDEAHRDSERKNSRVSGKGSGVFVDEKREFVDLQRETEDLDVEVSYGENYLNFEQIGRSTRESTPCNLIRDSETIETPGSTTRRTSSTRANRRTTNNVLQNIPTTHEMEEYFSCAEQEQQRLFIEKYNFDVANDLPLSGRYEWVQVIP